MSHFSIGERVRSSSEMKEGEVVAIGSVRIDDVATSIFVVDFHDSDILPFFEGDLESVEPDPYVVEVAYVFKAEIKAFSEYEAEQALREALVETLSWDGDEKAPDALQELEMRSVPVPARELA